MTGAYEALAYGCAERLHQCAGVGDIDVWDRGPGRPQGIAPTILRLVTGWFVYSRGGRACPCPGFYHPGLLLSYALPFDYFLIVRPRQFVACCTNLVKEVTGGLQ